MSSQLFSPLKLGPVTVANRIAVAPMCQYSAREGAATGWHQIHLGTLGLSGAGLVMLEATAVEEVGRITLDCLGIYSPQNRQALADTMDRIRPYALGRFGIQLGHAGRKASTFAPWKGGAPLGEADGAYPTIAPSAIAYGDGWHTPREMTEADLSRVAAAFADAAVAASAMGLEVIELHMAHGYLLHQFFSPLTNQRTDGLGGSLENRMRFPLAVFDAVMKAVPDTVAVGARISGSDWSEGGATVDDAIALAKALDARGCAYVDITSGGLVPHARISVGPNYQVPFAAAVKRAVSMPVRAVGLITEPQQAEAILADGEADTVALARAFLADPRWPWRAAHALGEPLEWPPQLRRANPSSWIQ